MAKLVFKNGPYAGKSVAIPDGKSLTLGRNRDIELPLPDLKLSRKHCQVALEGNQCILRDLGSTNGTFLNGTRIAEDQILNDFDRIVLGDTEIEFFGDEAPLPKPFDTNAQDPFGINDDDDILPEGSVPAVPEVPKAGPVPPAPPTSNFNMPQKTPAHRADPVASAGGGGGFETDDLLDTGPSSGAPAPQPAQARAAAPVVVQAPAGNIAAPMEIEIQEDPLAEALADLRKPLPPEPPGSQSTSPAVKMKAQLRFCDVCSGSIPVLDWDLGQAKEVNGSNVCKDCLAKGVDIPTGGSPAAPVSPVPQPAAQAPKTKNLDDILAGLDEEAVVVDTSVKRRGTALDEQEAQRRIGQMQKLTEAAAVRPNLQRPVQNPPAKADKVKEALGDDFEEIG